MMRRLVERHRGIPFATIESIWRVISRLHSCPGARSGGACGCLGRRIHDADSAVSFFGFVVPYVSHFSAQAAVEAVAKSKATWRWFRHLQPHAVVERAGSQWRAKDHRAVAVPGAR
jgi:hypothetical protein